MKRNDPVQTTKGAAALPERFLAMEGQPLRTLLPDDDPEGDGCMITLLPGACVEGVAGGAAAIDGAKMLGGWCSFRCELTVPRRFAARETKRLAAGIPTEEVLRGKFRCVLQRLLEDAAGRTDRAGLRASLSRRLREEAGRELLCIGWRLTGCRMENVQITRSEDA